MRFRIVAPILAVLFVGTWAAGQNQPASAKPGAEKKEPLYFVQIAADVAGNVQLSSLNGFTGVYVDSQNWGSGLKDGDLGPFMKVKEAKAGRSAACLFSSDKDVAMCVYFDGDTPFGVAVVKADSSGKIADGAVSAAYKNISKEMLTKSDRKLNFEPGNVNADDGQELPAFTISNASKLPTT